MVRVRMEPERAPRSAIQCSVGYWAQSLRLQAMVASVLALERDLDSEPRVVLPAHSPFPEHLGAFHVARSKRANWDTIGSVLRLLHSPRAEAASLAAALPARCCPSVPRRRSQTS